MEPYVSRIIESNIKTALARGKSVLLLGARQTGKTTVIQTQIKPDLSYSFAKAHTRLRYEANVELFEKELEAKIKTYSQKPLIFIDEVQKIPQVMDIIQVFIDEGAAQFILSGSSARKLKHGKNINLLPGRVVSLSMSPLVYNEMFTINPPLEDILLYGTLPGIISGTDHAYRETDLYSYVTTYLEDEIRAEAAVRNIGHFTRFLEVAAGEAGKVQNFSRISQDIGIAHSTVANYYQLLEDCLIVHRIDPLTESQTKRRLIKSPKYLFFDLGIRRACANEGVRLPQAHLGYLFEHYVGNELISLSQFISPQIKLRHWQDAAGPEVDYVIDYAHHYAPIEVKWTDKPGKSDARHLKKFIEEYPTQQAYIICRTPQAYQVDDNITAVPWQNIQSILESLVSNEKT